MTVKHNEQETALARAGYLAGYAAYTKGARIQRGALFAFLHTLQGVPWSTDSRVCAIARRAFEAGWQKAEQQEGRDTNGKN